MNLQNTHKLRKADEFCNAQTPVTLTGLLASDIIITTRNNRLFFATVANRKGSLREQIKEKEDGNK